MTDSPLVPEVAGLIRTAAKLGPQVAIGPDSRLIDDLGIDSLDLVGVFLKVQDHYDVAIEDDDVPTLLRVRDLATYIDHRRASAA